MDRIDLTCPVCGRQALDRPPKALGAERTCRHCGTLLLYTRESRGEDDPALLVVVEQQQPGPPGSTTRPEAPEPTDRESAADATHRGKSSAHPFQNIMPEHSRINAAVDWWSRAQILTGIAWRSLRAAPTIFWPLAVAFLAAATGLYVAEGIDPPLGLGGLILGPGIGLWFVTMSVSALAHALTRSTDRDRISFGRSLRMLLEHRKALSHRIALWIGLGFLGAGTAAILVSLVTAAALFLPAKQLFLGLFLGIEVLAAAALLPLAVLVGAGLALQPLLACNPSVKTSLKEELDWWTKSTNDRDWLATGVLLSGAATAAGLLLGLVVLDAVLELNALVIPTGMKEVLSASVLAPLLGLERAVDPSLSLQIAGAAASAGICGALAVFLTPAAALWSAGAAAAASIRGPGAEDRTRD